MKKAIALFSGFILIYILLVLSIQTNAFNMEWYSDFYRKTGLAEELNVSQQDLDKSMQVLLEYVSGQRENLDETIIRQGNEKQIYNDKEKAHMVDVRNLWLKVRLIAYELILLFLLLYYYFSPPDQVEILCLGIWKAYGVFLVFLIMLGLWILMDFTSFWTAFHHLFFSNQLWLLDPKTDFMILICPENLFSSLIMQILKSFGLFSAGALSLSGLMLLLHRKLRKSGILANEKLN